MTDTNTIKTNANGIAIFNVLKDADRALTLAEIADIAGIEAKSGYLTAAKKIAKDSGKRIALIEDGAEYTIHTIKTYASGLVVESDKVAKANAYRLEDAE